VDYMEELINIAFGSTSKYRANLILSRVDFSAVVQYFKANYFLLLDSLKSVGTSTLVAPSRKLLVLPKRKPLPFKSVFRISSYKIRRKRKPKVNITKR